MLDIPDADRRVKFVFWISPYQDGKACVRWLIQPDGRYFEDEDGYGAEHCEEIEVRRGDKIEAGAYIAVEGKKGSAGTYTHVEMRNGRHTTTNPYRNTILESDCPYPVMQDALGVTESGRQPVTAAAVMEAQRMREEAEAAARAEAEAENEEPEIELIDVLDTDEDGYGFAEETVVPEATLPPATK